MKLQEELRALPKAMMLPAAAPKHVCQWIWSRCWAATQSRLTAPLPQGTNMLCLHMTVTKPSTYRLCFHPPALFAPQVEGMEGTKLLSKLLAGVWIARTQGCCSQLGAGGVRNPLGSEKLVSKCFTEMQGWEGKRCKPALGGRKSTCTTSWGTHGWSPCHPC